ncbi:transcriptional regulator [Mycobacteroides abscessus subsp. abscessus]|uniref:TetR/AcrR family transcriptional regulator n=1 Tax=Mycobacteroides abscessus TaxID=36809 RepID=UPI00092A2F15|nr:TetR family transcriptional regulator [Mycobacteroides abscessus]MDM2349434.1 TetR family transcriptional regulator [Mycobacteroides abscessus]MDM2357740.1 TetR family transcriptional regulator [Mycobacteroides abscessus]SID40097.1 transcriptional regulator [Mycobacteroides abscessus subsp. abscessus]SKU69576.1 transcriptional regulator [Mycobacteroides abscessus subsp. abscessus]
MSKNSAKIPKNPPRGRRPGASGTRQAIYEAARSHFAKEGYAATTIRKIAASAGVDVSLVMQFFGSKDQLFAAVMAIPPAIPGRINEAFAGPQDGMGERLTRAYLNSWDGAPQESEPLLALLRGAIAQEGAAVKLRDFIQARLTAGVEVTQPGDSDEALLRACLAASMLIGVVVGRRIVGLPALQEHDIEALTTRLAPAIQTVLTPAPRR